MSSENASPNSGPVVTPDAAAVATGLQQGTAALPVKRGRGRPKGSKNKPKGDGEGSAAKKPRTSAKPKGGKVGSEVDAVLKACRVTNPPKVSMCLKAGILSGNVKLLKPEDDTENKFGLDQVLTESDCPECGESVKCKVRDILYQPDYGGDDYEDGGMAATLHCEDEDCPGIYVTQICTGDFRFDSGKFHNHCVKCPKFGKCLGDYREAHCRKCGSHYYAAGGFKCLKCSRK